MTLRKLLWSLWPHKHKYGRPFDRGAGRIKECRMCGIIKPVKRRVRKGTV